MNNIVHPIILAGGSGTRLWPLSRSTMPKQFTELLGDKTLFTNTILRLKGEVFSNPIIVTGELSRFIVQNQLEDSKTDSQGILIEPVARDTACAALAGIIHATKISNDPIILLCPADHWIKDTLYFRKIIKENIIHIRDDNIITFGIKPQYPHTGYGWITTNNRKNANNKNIFEVLKFVEKPNFETAKKLFDDNANYWNSGIFMAKASFLIDSYKIFNRKIYELVNESYKNAINDLGFIRLERENWQKLKKISIDHAIIENLKNIYMVPFQGIWSDVGSLHSLMQHYQKDNNNNVTIGNSTLIESENTFLNSITNQVHLVGVGLNNIIAVATKDAILCIDKRKTEKVKDVVKKLIEDNVEQANKSPEDFRPWGKFEVLSRGKNFQVKKIQVLPNCKLSLQSHRYRSEHWVVVEGKARVTLGEKVVIISENESIYINAGVKHRLENSTKEIISIIEVQTGSYLGEDDIIRYDDDYKRLSSD